MSVELDPEEAKHAVRVLRLQTGWWTGFASTQALQWLMLQLQGL